MASFKPENNTFRTKEAMRLLFNMLSNLGLSPPNFTYTNVHDGIGIVGGLNLTRSEWYNLTELLSNPNSSANLFPSESSSR